MKKFKEMGLITWKRRFNSSNHYQFLPGLFSCEVASWVRGLYFISLALLLSNPTPILTPPAKSHGSVDRKNVPLRSYNELTSNVFTSLKTETIPKKENLGERMEQKINIEGEKREMIRKLKDIVPLTKHGMLYLARYDTTALKRMIELGERSLDTTDPFRYLCGVGEKTSKLPLDMQWYHQHREKLEIPQGDTDFISTVRLQIIQAERKARLNKKNSASRYGKGEEVGMRNYDASKAWEPEPYECPETPEQTIANLKEYVAVNGSNYYLNLFLENHSAQC